MSEWIQLESDPAVLTELVEKIGVEGVEVEQVTLIDKDTLRNIKPAYGLVFLFQWSKSEQKDSRPVLKPEECPPELFFANQTVTNACATQAVISILLNRPEVKLGKELTNFKDFAVALEPKDRGDALGSIQLIRDVHNSFKSPEPYVAESSSRKATKESNHFVAYVPVKNKLYEIDGLKAGPIVVGDVKSDSEEDWLEKACDALQDRIARFPQTGEASYEYSLLAVVPRRKDAFVQRLKDIKSGNSMDVDGAATATEVKQLEEAIAAEDKKHATYKVENARRRHDYTPFTFTLLRTLAALDKLKEVTDAGVAFTKKKREAAQQRAKGSSTGSSSGAGAGAGTAAKK